MLGRRRAKCAIALSLPEIQAECRAMTDREAIEAQLIENLQRQGMHPIDQWKGTKDLLEAGSTIEDAAMALGLDTRAARKMALLATLHPDVKALILTDMPSAKALAAIAYATPEQQAAALKAPYAVAEGAPNWTVIANGCRVGAIPRGFAIFDVDTAGVAFEEDLFAEPNAPDQFITRDTVGFMAAQGAALERRVEEGLVEGQRIALAEWHGHDVKLPPGWARRWTDGPKAVRREDSGVVRVFAISRAPTNFGAVVEVLAEPPAGDGKFPARGNVAPAQPASRPAAARAGTAERRENAPAPEGNRPEAAKPPRPVVTPAELAALARRPDARPTGPLVSPKSQTKRGRTIAAAAKTAALRDHLCNPPGAHEGLSLLTRCLLLALAADNVQVCASKYTVVTCRDLVDRLVDAAGNLIELNDAELLDLLRVALARMLLFTSPPNDFGSGAVADYVAVALDVPAPRLDTPEFLETLHSDELHLVARVQDPDRSMPTTVAALRKQLARKLPHWRPVAFGAPGPKAPPTRRTARNR